LHRFAPLVKTGDVSCARNLLDGSLTVATFTLAHLSDPHLAPLPKPRLGELMNKRVLGYVNWVRNRKDIHSRRMLDALTADLREQSPDHVAITGDLVNIALAAEFTQAHDWLQTIGTPQNVTLVPGNHDAYLAATWPRCGELWCDYMRGDGAASDMPARFPYTRRRGPLLLIGVSTAVPTAPFMATGELGRDQLAALAALLSRHAGDDCFRVLLIHHPLRSNRRHKRLTDAPALLDILRTHGVQLILHGHDHKHSLMWIDGPSGQLPAIGVPSASAAIDGVHDPASYNLFRIEKQGNAWHCRWTVRGFGDTENAGITELRQEELR
jgi:3',5'-cyclic AMP phosphodiesterase CpdA